MSDQNNETVLTALSQVIDPALGKDIVTLGYVKNININAGCVTFTLAIPAPLFPSKEKMREKAEAILSTLPGISSVEIKMKTEIQTAVPTRGVPGVKHIVAVGSGKGGVGKSTVAANLAAIFSEYGAKVGLVDGDIYGPTVPILMGARNAELNQNERGIIPIESHGIKFMSMGLLSKGSAPLIWRGPMAHKAIQESLLRVDWGEIDYLFVDMPPGTGDVHLTLVQTVPVTGAVIVTTPQDVGMTISLKTFRMFEQTKVPVLGLIENMSTYQCLHCGKEDDIFGAGTVSKEAERLRVPFLGGIPLSKKIREYADSGMPVIFADPMAAGPYVDIADKLATEIYVRNYNKRTLIIEEEPEEASESFTV
ncbi:MAG: Mrp/NBP35 family ATP-binding protein [Nitrospirota bacterium]